MTTAPSAKRATSAFNPFSALPLAALLLLSACGGGGGGGASGPDTQPQTPTTPNPPVSTPGTNPGTNPGTSPGTDPTPGLAYVPLYPAGTPVTEQIQYTEPDGTLVTFMGSRTTERHARERGEAWDAPDNGPGRYFTYPTFYFQNRTFGLEIRDEVPAGRQKITVVLHVNDGVFDGTTFSLFRNINNPDVRDFGWSLNYGFNNPDEGGKPICYAGKRSCQMDFSSNWRTDPHSRLKVGDPIELAPAPRLTRDAQGRALVDGGGSRYYSFEQLYVVGVGMRPWYGVAPNLDSAPLPDEALLGGQASVSYNYSEEPMRVFQQMANNIGIANTRRFVEGRRLFHTSFADGRHSEHERENPVFSAHIGQMGPRFQQENCIACHVANGRSPVAALGTRLDGMTVLAGSAGATDGRRTPDPTYGLNVQQRATATGAADYGVSVQRLDSVRRTLPDGTVVELVKPVLAFKGPVPEASSLRLAPQVIGMGLLEAVAEADILALADPTDRDGDGVLGRANLVKDPETGQVRVGRFGWKAAKVSLRHQAAEALMNDLSVTTPVYPNRSCQAGAANCRNAGGPAGVTEAELQTLTHYLSLIGVPAQRSLRSGYPAGIRVSPEHDVDPARIARGAALFAQVKCVACHTPQLKTGNTHPFAELRGQAIRPYTNLLLHDMGPDLADGITEGQAGGAFWRTPPLWGLGSLKYVQGGETNVRYLHDGRARSLTEAILWHGGEAQRSRTLFEALARDDRAALVTFLESL